jgi:hypothetical protein
VPASSVSSFVGVVLESSESSPEVVGFESSSDNPRIRRGRLEESVSRRCAGEGFGFRSGASLVPLTCVLGMGQARPEAVMAAKPTALGHASTNPPIGSRG